MRRIIGLGIIMVMLLLLVFTVPGERGLIKTYHLHQELVALKAGNTSLRQKNYLLAQEAYLLKKDRSYIEHIIMEEMNLVRPGDIVVIFKGKKK